MRAILYAGAVIAAFACEPRISGSILDATAASLLEALPFILASSIAAKFRLGKGIVAYAGCGCSSGPSARSIPAAIMTWMLFGPAVALLRFATAAIIAPLTKAKSAHCGDASVLDVLASLMPAAFAAGTLSVLTNQLPQLRGLPPAIAFPLCAVAAVLWSPCALGVPAIALSLHHWTWAASAGFLTFAGLFDLRTFRKHSASERHDALGYILCAIACVAVALHHGNGLLHPKFTAALWIAAAFLAAIAFRHRRGLYPGLRIAPAIMLAGAVLTTQPPAYRATETTIADAYPGEQVDFTGEIMRNARATTLVRYAITCCRADAAPVAVRLANASPTVSGWMHVRGTLITSDSGFELRARTLENVPQPADPFVYR